MDAKHSASTIHMEQSIEAKPQDVTPDIETATAAHLYLGKATSVPPPQATTTTNTSAEDSNGKVINRLLLPRPTSDPKDPLTWPLYRKHLILLGTCLFVFLSNYTVVSLQPILLPVMTSLDLTLTQAGNLITFPILMLGLGNLFWIPLSQKVGKRPVLVASSAIFFGAGIWSALARSYASLLAARIVAGVAASCSESLGPAVVADLYFVHERGLWVGVYTLMFTVGTALGGVFSGLVANATSQWRWVFWKNAVLTGVMFVVVLLFQAETNFKRPVVNETGEGLDAKELPALRARADSSWAKSLGFLGWYDREASIWRLWWRPFLTMQYPAVVWCTLTYGSCLGWMVLQTTANGAVFPQIYGFSSLAIGNISCAYLVAAFVGTALGSPLSDYVVRYITKQRGGYFSPEFRLWSLIPGYLFAPVGLLLWGFGLENRLPYMVPIAGTGITYGVLCAVPAIATTYVVDCHRPLTAEAMTILFAAKNAFAFALSYAVFPWLSADGPGKVSGWNTLIEGVIFLTAIPMYMYGERLRKWSAKLTV